MEYFQFIHFNSIWGLFGDDKHIHTHTGVEKRNEFLKNRKHLYLCLVVWIDFAENIRNAYKLEWERMRFHSKFHFNTNTYRIDIYKKIRKQWSNSKITKNEKHKHNKRIWWLHWPLYLNVIQYVIFKIEKFGRTKT